MKVLQINNVYNYGSTGKITRDLHQVLVQDGVESFVCYGRRTRTSDKNVVKICTEAYGKANGLFSRLTGVPYGGCILSTNKLIRIISKNNPDVVHLHCLNGHFVNIYRLIDFLKHEQIPTVLTLHAEFMHTANCGHSFECEKWLTGCGDCPDVRSATGAYFFDRTHYSWEKLRKAFSGFDKLAVVSVSPWVMERAQRSPILADKNHMTIYNGIDTSVFHPYDTHVIRKQLGILPEEKVVLHVTAGFSSDPGHIKGGYYIRQLAERLHDDKVRVIVVGAVEKAEKLPENMIMLGNISDQQKLAQIYSLADVTVITSKRETFSMVCAESLCCGTPVVGFEAGAPEMISLPEYSSFCKHGDINKLYTLVLNSLAMNTEKAISEKAERIYSVREMARKYKEVYGSFN